MDTVKRQNQSHHNLYKILKSQFFIMKKIFCFIPFPKLYSVPRLFSIGKFLEFCNFFAQNM